MTAELEQIEDLPMELVNDLLRALASREEHEISINYHGLAPRRVEFLLQPYFSVTGH